MPNNNIITFLSLFFGNTNNNNNLQLGTILSMKEGSLFCFVIMKFTELGCASDHVVGVVGKLSMRRRVAWALVP